MNRNHRSLKVNGSLVVSKTTLHAMSVVGLLFVGCGVGDTQPTSGYSASTAPLTVGGHHCPTSGEIAGRDQPGDGRYYITTFGGGGDTQPMACGGSADGSWYYIADSWRFGCGAHVRITNPSNGQSCVAQVADVGPNICVEQAAGRPVIDASPLIAQALFSTGAIGWSNHTNVTVELVARTTPLGCGDSAGSGSGGTDGGTGSRSDAGSGSGGTDGGTGSGSDAGSGSGSDAGTDTDASMDCASGETMCDTSCVDLQSDTSNCGSCGNACESGQTCDSGSCSASSSTMCTDGQTDCSGSCVDLQSDTSNCGSCGTACDSGQTCDSGSCSGSSSSSSCDPGQDMCDGSCVDLSSDMDNCGSCGTACDSSASETCNGGVCQASI